MPPIYKLRIRERAANKEIFCVSRGIWVALTPEESVRQQFIRYLVTELGYDIGRISVEQSFTIDGGKMLRADIVVYGADGKPFILVECKASSVDLSSESFRQASKYNAYFKANYVVLTNGNSTLVLYTSDLINYNFEKSIPKL
ncbi:MAG: type I restriction enzyme HsdR N-terminal domain-containing protein [Rikenellaceae bacterium]